MTLDTDVLIVGYGPVGQTLAALLARRGHRVAVYERYSGVYDLPRALVFDDEVMQVWQALGIAEELDVLPVEPYEWFGADGDPIFRLDFPPQGPSGWAPGYYFHQPTLERALDRHVRTLPAATLHCGWSAESLEQVDEHVEVTLRRVREPRTGQLEPTGETRTVRTRYVVGADGANSLVREAAGIAFHDLGFAAQWLVVDIRPHDIDALSSLPAACQWCDPARPHMHARNGRTHRRFEFMLLPGERAEDFADPARVWQMLSPWITPAEGTLLRQSVYEFRGRLAQTMRSGRVLLAGDAAHTMPPFMGQGLCSGVRDAANLAWRLDLILAGAAEDRLLDAYTAERRAHNEWIVNLSTEMGRMSCTLDARTAAERDAALRAAGSQPPPPLPALQEGTLAGDRPLAGTRAVQGSVRVGREAGRWDDVFGRHFALVTRQPVHLTASQVAFLDRIGAHLVALSELEDLDGRLTAWFDEHRLEAVLIRPDAYVFGATEWPDEAPALIDDLQLHLTTANPRPIAHVR